MHIPIYDANNKCVRLILHPGILLPNALALCSGEDKGDGLFQAVWLSNSKWIPLGQEDGSVHLLEAGQLEWKVVVHPHHIQ